MAGQELIAAADDPRSVSDEPERLFQRIVRNRQQDEKGLVGVLRNGLLDGPVAVERHGGEPPGSAGFVETVKLAENASPPSGCTCGALVKTISTVSSVIGSCQRNGSDSLQSSR